MIEIKCRTISPADLSVSLSGCNCHELIDVRTPPEYSAAHVPGAKLIPLGDLKIQDYLATHTPGTPIDVLCQAGQRASQAIAQFERAGSGDCVLVEGGTQAWIDAGLPVHRGAGNVLPLMRQVQIVVGALSIAGAALALTLSPWFTILPLLLGCGLLFAGITGHCGLALLLARMPWNRGQNTCTHCCTPE